ncbi:MAG: hypothetical protein OHK0041_11060 [Anaerolineales bacterium]
MTVPYPAFFKRLLIGPVILLTAACQTAAPAPTATLPPTAAATRPPTPIPVTSTPEPTPTPAPSPTPFPRFFTQEFDSPLAGWDILQAGSETSPNVSVEGGALRLQMDVPYAWLYALYNAEEYADVYIEAEYVNSALTPASAGLICRYSETDGWLEYNVLTDGTYNVLYGKWLDAGIADYLPILDGTAPGIKQSGDVQQIALTCTGATLYLYINGSVIRSVNVERYNLPPGKAGLTASSFENAPVIAAFNRLTIREP